MLRAVAVFSAFLTATLLWADGGHDHGKMAGEKLGTVHFSISCGTASQAAFDRAMAMQHSFWFEKSYETFRDLAAKDPDCAMAHWGVAMSQYHPLWAPPTKDEFAIGAAAIEKAKNARKATPRERKYVAAIAAYYTDADKLDAHARAANYKRAMGALYESEPKDTEAAILYALALDATADPKDKTFANQKRCGEILKPIFQKQPQHPGLAHYLIHCYDNPVLAPQGLNAARAYSKIAPSVPHAQHMPSHIFTRVGLWDESIASNSAAAAAGRKYERETRMNGMWYETAHALDYKQYALLQQGRVAEAQKIVDEMRGRPASDLRVASAAYGFASTSARQAVETQAWKTAASLKPQASKQRDADGNIYLARAMGNARLGNIDAARKDVEQLVDIEKSLTDPYWHGQGEIKRLKAQAWLAFAEGRKEEAMNVAREAAAKEDATDKNPVTPGALIPAHEVVADLLFESKNYSETAKEYEASLKTSPGRYRALYGAARSSELAGDRKNARKYYTELLKVAEKGDARPELEAAKDFLSSNKVAAR
jgi:tetratricopeptide (TPR) repeat protein